MIALCVVWTLLALRIALAFARGEPLGDSLALPSLALFVCTAVLGGRLFSTFIGASRRDEEHT